MSYKWQLGKIGLIDLKTGKQLQKMKIIDIIKSGKFGMQNLKILLKSQMMIQIILEVLIMAIIKPRNSTVDFRRKHCYR